MALIILKLCSKKRYRVQFLNNVEDRSAPTHKHARLYDDKKIIADPQYRNDLIINSFMHFEQLLEIIPDYYLVISKDPYSWLISYKNWAQRCQWPVVPFHFILEYNLFYGKFLELSQQSSKIVFIRYIDLLQKDTEAFGHTGLKFVSKKEMANMAILTSDQAGSSIQKVHEFTARILCD